MMIVGLHSVADFFFKWKLAALWNSSLSCDDFKDPKSNVLKVHISVIQGLCLA